MKQVDVIGIGSVFVDYFLEGNDPFFEKHHLTAETDDISDAKPLFYDALKSLPLLQKSSGGAAVNTIAILARLGLQTAYHGISGEDAETSFWENQLQNVDLSKMIKKGNISPCACILTHERKKRTFVSFTNPYDDDFFEQVDYQFLERSTFLHIAPFYLDVEKSFEKLLRVLDHIHRPKLSVTLAMTYALFGLEKLSPLLRKTKILFVNETEIYTLTNEKKEKGSEMLLQYGPEIIVCTLGANGALITTKEKQFLSKGRKVKNIVDTTGAGDAFAAGFLYGLVKGESLEWSADFANSIAAKAITDYGLHWLQNYSKKDLLQGL